MGVTPSYSAASIVNSGNFVAGPLAPNSIATIFGTGLSRSTQQLAASDIAGGQMPVELNYTQVFVDNFPAPLFYVSDTQINFLIPSKQALGPCKIRVATQGNSGPEVTVTIVDAAPALFPLPSGYAITTHVDNSLVTADLPAHPGEIVVVYAIGLGKTSPNPATGELPKYAAPLVNPGTLQVSLAGKVLDAGLVKYAGLTPQSAGLYQLNIEIPGDSEQDPEIRVSLAGQSSPAGLKLAVTR